MNSLEGRIDEFCDGKIRAITNVFRRIERAGYSDDFLIQFQSTPEIENVILDIHPNSEKNITSICYALSLYAKFLQEKGDVPDDSIDRNIHYIQRKVLWEKAKKQVPKRFISHKSYLELIEELEYEDLNATYYLSLIRCIYEGAYSDNLSVLYNMRGKDIDIDNNRICLHSSYGNESDDYDYELPTDLLVDLHELSHNQYWERLNRFNAYRVMIEGLYPDSCFKIENRNRTEDDGVAFERSYANKMRKILDVYGYKALKPKQLFVSGVMYRIRLELEKNGYDLKESFSHNNKNREVARIIQNELDRCHYKTKSNLFRQIVNGDIEIFME